MGPAGRGRGGWSRRTIRTTGREIWEQTEGRVTVFVVGIGTGGTISGAARYLNQRGHPWVKGRHGSNGLVETVLSTTG